MLLTSVILLRIHSIQTADQWYSLNASPKPEENKSTSLHPSEHRTVVISPTPAFTPLSPTFTSIQQGDIIILDNDKVCVKRYFEPLVAFQHPCDWDVIHHDIQYGNESALEIWKKDDKTPESYTGTQEERDNKWATEHKVGHLQVYPKGERLFGKVIVTLEDFMHDGAGYIDNENFKRSCHMANYGMLLGYECNISSYGFPTFTFVSKKDERFIVIEGTAQESAALRELIPTIQLSSF